MERTWVNHVRYRMRMMSMRPTAVHDIEDMAVSVPWCVPNVNTVVATPVHKSVHDQWTEQKLLGTTRNFGG